MVPVLPLGECVNTHIYTQKKQTRQCTYFRKFCLLSFGHHTIIQKKVMFLNSVGVTQFLGLMLSIIIAIVTIILDIVIVVIIIIIGVVVII